MKILEILTALVIAARVLMVVAVLATVYSGDQLFREVGGLEWLRRRRLAGVVLVYGGILPVNLTYDVCVDVMGGRVGLRRTLYVLPGERAVIRVEPEELVSQVALRSFREAAFKPVDVKARITVRVRLVPFLELTAVTDRSFTVGPVVRGVRALRVSLTSVNETHAEIEASALVHAPLLSGSSIRAKLEGQGVYSTWHTFVADEEGRYLVSVEAVVKLPPPKSYFLVLCVGSACASAEVRLGGGS